MSEQTNRLGCAELASIVAEGNEVAGQLRRVLDSERAALAAGDVEPMDACGQQKAECVARLEELDMDRRSLCATLHIGDDDLDAMFAKRGLAATAAPGWQAFVTTLAACRDANIVNGQITHLRRRHVERALQILRGALSDDAGLYGPDGRDSRTEATVLGQA